MRSPLNASRPHARCSCHDTLRARGTVNLGKGRAPDLKPRVELKVTKDGHWGGSGATTSKAAGQHLAWHLTHGGWSAEPPGVAGCFERKLLTYVPRDWVARGRK